MTDKLRLNKNALREQTERLRSLREFLPTLELRKQQLQLALTQVRREQERLRAEGQRLRERVDPWAPMLRSLLADATPLAEVEQVVTPAGERGRCLRSRARDGELPPPAVLAAVDPAGLR